MQSGLIHYHVAVTDIYVFFYLITFAEKVFFCNPSSESKLQSRVTSLPGSLVASAKLHRSDCEYRIYSNKRRGAYLIFRATSAALIRGWRLFEGGAYLNIVPDKFTFSIVLFNGTLSIF